MKVTAIGLRLDCYVVLFLALICKGFVAADEDDVVPGQRNRNGDDDTDSLDGLNRQNNRRTGNDFNLSLMLETMGGDDLGNMFREMGRMLPNISLGSKLNFPALLQNNSCFQNHEKMKELFSDISGILTQSDDSGEASDLMSDPDDLFEKLSDTSAQCIMGSISNRTKMTMCQKFSRRKGSKTFGKLMTSGVDCVSVLLSSRYNKSLDKDDDDDDDDDEDELSLHQQKLIMHQLRKRPFRMWTMSDVDSAWQLAPDYIDDDLISELPDDLFESSIAKLGRLIAKGRGAMTLPTTLRKRLTSLKPPKQLRADDIRKLGRGFAVFDVDDIDEISSNELFEGILDDFDLEEDDPRSLAIGRIMQQGRDFSTFKPNDLKKLLPFQKGNPQFAKKLNPDVLAEALSLLSDMDIGDEAGVLCRTLRRSQKFDDANTVSATDLQALGKVLTGCGQSFVSQLPARAVQNALMTIKMLDFDDSEARDLLEKLNLGEARDLTELKIAMVGKLAKAFSLDEFENMPDDLMDDVFDDLDSVDLDDWKKLAIVRKALRADATKTNSLIFQYAAFANMLGIDDIFDFDSSDLRDQLQKAVALKVRHSLASAIMNKLKSLNPKRGSFRSNDLYSAGNMVIGLSHDDIIEFPDDRDEVLSLSGILSDKIDDLTDSQVEDVVDKIKKLYNLDDSDVVTLEEDDVLQTAPFLIHMKEKDFDKLRFSKPAKAAFLQTIFKTSNKKNSKKHMQYLFDKAVEMVHDLHDDKNKGPDDLDEVKIRELSGVLSGIRSQYIRQLPREAILRNLDIFEKADLGSDESKALVERVDRDDPTWNCRRERLAQIAPYLHQFSEDKLKSICSPELAAAGTVIMKAMEKKDEYNKERSSEGFSREDENVKEDNQGKVTVVRHIVKSLKDDNKRRRKRASGGLTCDAIKLMSSKVTLLDIGEIDLIDSNVEFKNCFERLGSYGDWTKEQLRHLLVKAEQSFGNAKEWPAQIIREGGSIVSAIPAITLGTMNLSSSDIMAKISQHGLMNQEQLRAAVYRWLHLNKKNDAKKITGPELSSLKEFVCGLDNSDIDQLPSESFKAAISDLGKVRTCSKEKLRALGAKSVRIFGAPVSGWSAALVADLGSIIGGLDKTQIKQLSANHIAEIRTEVIPYIPKETLKDFSAEQLKLFSKNQANSVTQVQYNFLEPEQRVTLNEKATLPFGNNTSISSHVQHLSLTSLLLTVLFCVAFS